MTLLLPIHWSGPLTFDEATDRLDDGGTAPDYDGPDYGLYQIYGSHILSGPGTLLYVGSAIQQTFSRRLSQHDSWVQAEEGVSIYVGRLYLPERHFPDAEWETWRRDVAAAEAIMIHKYTPNYNSSHIYSEPDLRGHERIRLIHSGSRGRLHPEDIAPDDFRDIPLPLPSPV